MLRGRQADLSSVISRDAERLSAMADAAGSSPTSSSTGGGGDKVVYELYREGGASFGPSSYGPAVAPSPREGALEERLRRLEIAVGSSSHSPTPPAGGGGGGGEGRSVLDRLREAEALAREVDASAIDRLAARARVVRADLEAAARAKSKLSSSSSHATAPS